MSRKIWLSFLFFLLIPCFLWGNHPVVFLHGWNSDDKIWNNLKSLLVNDSNYRYGELIAYSYYDSSFGYSIDTPIEDVAEGIARKITEVYYDNQETPVDLVAHSMGGLVVRAMLVWRLIDPRCIGKFVSIAVPNYGQNIEDLGGYQSSEMKYGATFLWDLADAWHLGQRSIPETLCIEGIGGFHEGSPWDGLVHHWSASLGQSPRRYVPRVHAKAQSNSFYQIITGLQGDTIYACPYGSDDPVFRLVDSFLRDGTVLKQSQLWFTPPWEVNEQGGLFYQIIEPDGSQYSSSERNLISSFFLMGPGAGEISPDYIEHGYDNSESQQYGVEFVYGTMPVGYYRLSHTSYPYFFVNGVQVQPGSVSVYRFRTDGNVIGKNIMVSLNPMGGKLEDEELTKSVLGGKEYGPLPIPVKDGYLFAGWRLGSAEGELIDPETYVDFSAEDHELLADWVKISEVEPPDFKVPLEGKGKWIFRLTDRFSKEVVLQNELIGNSENVRLYTRVTGPGKFSFSWKSSSEANCDFVVFCVCSNWYAKISGTGVNWEKLSFELPEGDHLLHWWYKKDAYDTQGGDCAWIKDLHWEPYAGVHFDPDGGEVTPDYHAYPLGSAYEILPTPLREDFSFSGWSTTNGIRVTIDSPVSLQDDFKYLKARWVPLIPWHDALDTTFRFTGGSRFNWVGQTAETADGKDALQCFGFLPGQTDKIETVIEGSGLVSFQSRISSMSNGVTFALSDHGTTLVADSDAHSGWKQHSVPLKQGSHLLALNCSASSRGTEMDSIWFDQFKWEPGTISRISFDSKGGLEDLVDQWTLVGRELGGLPIPQRKGYAFLGWSSSPVSNDWVTAKTVSSAEEMTLYAVWNHSLDQVDDQPFAGKSMYYGYLLNHEGMVGVIQVRAYPFHADTGTASIQARMQAMGEGRASLRGIAVIDRQGRTTATLKGYGRTIQLELGADGISGITDSGLTIHCARNILQTWSDPRASEIDNWKGHWTFAMRVNDAVGEGADLAWGYIGFTVSVASRGRVRIYGILPDGFRVAISSWLMLSEDPDWACVPVHAPLYRGRLGGFALLLWLGKDGTVLVEEKSLWDVSQGHLPFLAELEYVDGGVFVPLEKGNLTFSLGAIPNQFGGTDFIDALLPIEQEVVSTGYRLVTPRMGRVTCGGIAREANPSGLRFSYNPWLGSYFGNFYYYTFRNGLLRRDRAFVSGAMVNGVGYGSARVRGTVGMEAVLR